MINNDKTKVIHFRRRNAKQTEVRFRIENTGSVLRLYNQIVQMPENRLTRKVFEYDVNHCEQVVNWTSNGVSTLAVSGTGTGTCIRKNGLYDFKKNLSHCT